MLRGLYRSLARSLPPSAMRNLRLLRAGGCRSAAATGSPQCFCLSAEPGVVIVGSQYGLVELRPAGDSVRAAAAGQGSGACRRVGVGFGCKAGLQRLRLRQRELAGTRYLLVRLPLRSGV